MKKLEKSIRHELADIAPGLRSGCYGLAGHYAGVMPSKGLVRDLYCDIDPDQGIVTGIRMYGAEGGREARDYYGESVDLSDALEHYLLQWYQYTWDDFVREICDLAQAEIDKAR